MINNTFTSLFKRCLRVILWFFSDNVEYQYIQRTIALIVDEEKNKRLYYNAYIRFVLMALSTGAAPWQYFFRFFFLFSSFYVISNFVDNNHQVGGLSVFWCVNDTKLNGMYLPTYNTNMHAKMNG